MGAEKTKLATTRPGLPRDGAAGLDSRGTIPTPPSPSLCACSSVPVGLGKRLLPVLVPPLQNISAINSFCHNARTMNTSRDEQRPKVFDKRSIVKLNRGEGGSLFYDLKTLPFPHLGDTKGNSCPAFSVKDVPFAPDENPRSCFVLSRSSKKWITLSRTTS